MALFGRGSFFRLPKHSRFEYKPRFYDPDKEKFEEDPKLKMEKGAFFKNRNSRIAGAFTSNDIVNRERRNRKAHTVRLGMLVLMLFLPFLYWLGYTNGLVTIVGLLILLILFISQANKI